MASSEGTTLRSALMAADSIRPGPQTPHNGSGEPPSPYVVNHAHNACGDIHPCEPTAMLKYAALITAPHVRKKIATCFTAALLERAIKRASKGGIRKRLACQVNTDNEINAAAAAVIHA